MKRFLRNTAKTQLLILILWIWGCEELPTSIEESNNNSAKTENKIFSANETKHFMIKQDENNDKLNYFQVGNTLNFENNIDLQYRWDFDGDGKWDTEWNSQKTVNFTFDDYEVYSTKLEIRDNITVLAEVEDQVAIEPTCVDVDGNFYYIVKIGKQWWMAENLRVKHYRNRDPVKEVKDKKEWRYLNSPAYCYYYNDENTPFEYGLLYNWRAAIDPRGLAPNGWHVPSDVDFQILENFLGGRGRAGGKMKENGTEHWYHPNNATNSSGFTALPGGYRTSRGEFQGFRGFGFLWSITPGPNSTAWNRYMDHMYPELERGSFLKRCGFSIRCVKDSN